MADCKYIYLYRHGETNLNVQGITMGQLSSLHTEFTEKGLNQIEDIKKQLIINSIEVIYSSDYERTVKTAKIANKDLNLPIFITEELRGLNMGKYQGLPMETFLNTKEVKECFCNHNLKFLNGESINDLNNRIIMYILNLCNEVKYNRIALITHSAVISNLKSYLLNEPYCCLNECILSCSNNNLTVFNYVENKEKKLTKNR